MNKPQGNPWYREPWPWLLMAGPAAVVVAGAVTIWLAVSGADGLVDDDYYKQGLEVNHRKHRDAAALAAGMSVVAKLGADGRSVTLDYRAAGVQVKPPVVNLHLAHPTRSGQDVDLALPLGADGLYRGALAESVAGRWHVTIDDPTKTWRLHGRWVVAPNAELQVNPPRND